MTKPPKLTPSQIWLLLHLLSHCGLTGRTTLVRRHRERVVPLWRRDLVEIWWRKVANDERSRGPYFSLSVDGHRLACAILAARDERRRSKTNGASPVTEPPQALAA